MIFNFEPEHRMKAETIRAGLNVLLKQDGKIMNSAKGVKAYIWTGGVQTEHYKNGLTRIYVHENNPNAMEVIRAWLSNSRQDTE